MWEVELPLLRPLTTAGQRVDRRRITIVRLVNGSHTGWGEAATYPGHTRDNPDEAWQLLLAESRRLLGAGDPVLIEGSAASAAIDQAITTLQAAAAGVSLAAHLGTPIEPSASSVAIGLGSAPDVIGAVAAANDAGYRHVKLKIAPGSLGTVEAVRNAFPDLGVAVDANASYRRADLEELEAMDRLALEYIEQPLAAPNLQGHQVLRRRVTTPIVLDEAVHRLGDVVTIATAGAADGVAIKPGRLGPTLTMRAFALAQRHGRDVKVGGLVETGIGKHSLATLAAHEAVTLPSDLAESNHWFARDLVVPPWALDAEGMMLPRLAIEVDQSALVDRAVRHHRFRR